MALALPTPSRVDLAKTASRYRILSTVYSLLDRYLSWPLPPRPSIQIEIPSTVSNSPGSIPIYLFTAPSQALSPGEQNTQVSPRPVLINFHGGGYTIGHALDDARWFREVLRAYPDAVVASVHYRCAPEYPFPVGLEDGVDAILWLWEHAERYNLDRTRFVICGWSAGGNLSLALPFRLRDELEKRPQSEDARNITLAGIVGFYPAVDWTRTREERDATNPIAAEKSMITPSLFKFFDDSYLDESALPKLPGTDNVDMSHPYLSPALAPDSLLSLAYPPAVAIYTCSWDQLLVEGNTFRERLRALVAEGKMVHVGGLVIDGVIHAFDKKPSFWGGNPARDDMYGDAVKELKIMWNIN